MMLIRLQRKGRVPFGANVSHHSGASQKSILTEELNRLRGGKE